MDYQLAGHLILDPATNSRMNIVFENHDGDGTQKLTYEQDYFTLSPTEDMGKPYRVLYPVWYKKGEHSLRIVLWLSNNSQEPEKMSIGGIPLLTFIKRMTEDIGIADVVTIALENQYLWTFPGTIGCIEPHRLPFTTFENENPYFILTSQSEPKGLLDTNLKKLIGNDLGMGLMKQAGNTADLKLDYVDGMVFPFEKTFIRLSDIRMNARLFMDQIFNMEDKYISAYAFTKDLLLGYELLLY